MAGGQVGGDQLGGVEPGLLRSCFEVKTPAQLERGEDTQSLRETEPGVSGECYRGSVRERLKSARADLAREFENALARSARSQQDGQELSAAKRRRTERHQTFARAVGRT